ncbi:PLP-dependent cysteine synthase family protein [Azospirillum brasilense]|uniref:L-cysteine desulfhydrase Cds1 n=1 Tax=Azospirillum brasilense TaxID=192 RepID=A0A0P0F6G0_AZOBR|nr:MULTISPECIES: PLP-dependent cysteine synthase family protein [Azospirillum]ALJ38908.1 cysteine synthase [Azospirillum brasilense]MBK3731936.1 pyridoxal-phosphate dependent enzyme [Azospirillum brasilense]MDW7557339.1 PLP-dependent cysteine synthase family protein [Azospirillum brasilense]MDW7597008.1 PLP-dependent cysteine synthase family protein [Azospirillum brasilense]MDW7632175.1 PLP-dependent cysteine synthase family protein [Azospirillum brasilense]
MTASAQTVPFSPGAGSIRQPIRLDYTPLPEVACRDWTRRAIELLETEAARSPDTPLLKLDVPELSGIDVYLKDESTHPTGSLKHRVARSLLLFAICNGRIGEGTPVIEASSGSTAVSEAYFARLLGLPFHAVMPRGTSDEKVAAIELHGGRCHFVDSSKAIYAEAAALAVRLGGVYLDQFTYAERATDWRTDNIAQSIFGQMRSERHPVPDWIVMSAGTGGTAATIGRHIRYRHLPTRLCVPDAEHSVFYESFVNRDAALTCERGSRIEGIGRPRVEPSFIPEVVDQMIKVPDVASLAAMRVLSRRLGRMVGGSTGTNFFGLCWIAGRMRDAGRAGSLVTLICDSGERYRNTYHDDAWMARAGFDTAADEARIEAFLQGGPSL